MSQGEKTQTQAAGTTETLDGLLDTAAMKPIARCGYDEYAMVETVFKMTRPKGGG